MRNKIILLQYILSILQPCSKVEIYIFFVLFPLIEMRRCSCPGSEPNNVLLLQFLPPEKKQMCPLLLICEKVWPHQKLLHCSRSKGKKTVKMCHCWAPGMVYVKTYGEGRLVPASCQKDISMLISIYNPYGSSCLPYVWQWIAAFCAKWEKWVSQDNVF